MSTKLSEVLTENGAENQLQPFVKAVYEAPRLKQIETKTTDGSKRFSFADSEAMYSAVS